MPAILLVRPFRDIVADLAALIGRKLTAHISGAQDMRAVDRVPIRLIRDGDLEAVAPEIVGAARAFAAGG